MPRPSLAQLRGALEFQHTYMWDVSVIRSPAGVEIDTNQWNMQCVSHAVPTMAVQVAEVALRGHNILEPGRIIASNSLEVTMVETTDAYVRKIIKSWNDAFRNRSEPVKRLLGEFSLRLLNNKGGVGNEGFNWVYKIHNVFMETSGPPTMEGGSDDPAQWSLTLRYSDMSEEEGDHIEGPGGEG